MSTRKLSGSATIADVAHEDERRVEVDAALAEDARQLDRQRRAAAVVVDAGREVVERRVGIGRRRGSRVGIGAAAPPAFGVPWPPGRATVS